MELQKTQVAKVSKSDLALVDDNLLNQKQLSLLLKKTPEKYVKQRPAKGGGKWNYVEVSYVQKVLNLMFGWDWDFEIVDEKVLLECKEVVVKGRLTCRMGDKTIVKTQYGNKEIIFKHATDEPLSIGNDLKAAASDALKKCASLIGIAADIYGRDSFVEVSVQEDITPDDWFQLKLMLDDKKDKVPSQHYLVLKEEIEQEVARNYYKNLNYLKSIK